MEGQAPSGSYGSQAGPSSTWEEKPPVVRHRVNKTSTAACGPCKRAHLACDDGRPCKRCSSLNKEDQCVDVPQKKRGRPKLSANTGGPSSTSSARSRPKPTSSTSTSPSFSSTNPHNLGRPSPHNSHQTPYQRPPQPPLPNNRSGYSIFPSDFSLSAPSPPPEPPSQQRILTVFSTMDFTMIRSSDSSSPILGRPSSTLRQHWLGTILSGEDVQALEPDRVWLMTGLSSGMRLTTAQEAVVWIEQSSESMLESPVAGTSFPARDVSVRRADGSWEDFNLRMHVGQGAGLDLRDPNTYSRAYLVISLLAIRPMSPFSGSSGNPSAATDSPPPSRSRRPSSPGRPPLPSPHIPSHPSTPSDPSYSDNSQTLPPISTLTSSIGRFSPPRIPSSRPGTSSSSASANQLFRPFANQPPPPPLSQGPRPITSDGLARPFSSHRHPGGGITLPSPFVLPFNPNEPPISPYSHNQHSSHPYARPSTGYSQQSNASTSQRKDSGNPYSRGLQSYAARGSLAGSSISGASSFGGDTWREDASRGSRGSDFGWGSRPGTGTSSAYASGSGVVGPAPSKPFGGFPLVEGREVGGVSEEGAGGGAGPDLPPISSLFSYTPPPPGPPAPPPPPTS
ncbi:hypothetical protein BDY24DRAFT_403690 [Mrakia frigida]|uniref:Zn(II)2Cys6 transcription factor domain-containing protein n=1 Tax=Mrakia frigida TaxID=29902 RepID=UPI003FCBEFD6